MVGARRTSLDLRHARHEPGASMRPLFYAALCCLAAASPRAAFAAPDARALFLENCATCHGEKGDADTNLGTKYMAADFTSPEFKKKFSAATAKKAITNGVKKTKMKAWKGVLSPEDIDALAQYVTTFPAAEEK
jgi:mono/diheme cytochrome c family protein